MKLCPTCRHTYPDDYQTCPRDQSALTTDTLEIVPGTILRGKYEVLCELGAGGMATVYKVRHKAFQELAAVKVVHRQFMHDPGFVKRFRNEAIVARQLKHPNAVRIDDFDYTEDERPFIVMEYVEGSSLYEVRKQHGGPWPVERCINIISQAASALSAAHTLGIVHRDIKPSNILLLRGSHGEGVVKVLDFGIAKVSDNAIAGMTSVLTQQNLIIGTPEYMSPEQASGHLENAIDGRADLYSLGLIFYEMLTGAHPFQADTPMGMLIQQLHTLPAPPESFPIPIPAAISALVLKALRKEPKDRFQSASEMLEAMRDPEAWYNSTRNTIQKQGPAAPSATYSPLTPDSVTAAMQPPSSVTPVPPLSVPTTPLPFTPPVPTSSQASPSVQIPFVPVIDPSAPPNPPPSVATTTPPTVPPAPTPFAFPQPIPPQVSPTVKKSKAPLFVGVTLAAMLLLAVGLFFGYRTIMSKFKASGQATTTPTPQTPPPDSNGASETATNVTKLVTMGNNAIADKQYELAATFFQQALSLDPQNTVAKAGLETAHNGGSTTSAASTPANPPPPPVVPATKNAPSVEKPKPIKTGPVKVPSAVMFGKLVSSPAPVYPPVAKSAHIQGEVTLHAIIAKDGSVKTVEPISGLKIFHESAINAVQQWRYTPYLVNNVPTEVDTTITVNYAIAKK
ncbi:MAG TPA: TonB family protein [Edaphobacter sp.]|nr:TonB family protein [Edaphobacter sp.]